MRNSRITSSAGNVVQAVVYFAIVGLVIIMILGLVRYFQVPKGMYLNFDGEVVTEETDVAIQPDGSDNIFRIANTKGFGSYSVADCMVKIVPNVDAAHDFDFMLAGESAPYQYSAESDLSAAFCKEVGETGIRVLSDGTFALSVKTLSMRAILQEVYPNQTIVLEQDIQDVQFGQYPYFAISITSPDGTQTLKIPFRFNFEVVKVSFDKEVIVF